MKFACLQTLSADNVNIMCVQRSKRTEGWIYKRPDKSQQMDPEQFINFKVK